jgi:hypothetical protein
MRNFNGVIDIVQIVSAVSLTTLNDFSGVIDPAEICMTLLKFQIFGSGPQLFFKGNIQQNYFIGTGKYSHTISFSKIKQKVGEFSTSFSVSAVSLIPMKPNLTTFESIILANTKPCAKRF